LKVLANRLKAFCGSTFRPMEHKYRFFYTFLLVCARTVALDVTIQTFKESSWLYYDHLGEAQLYGAEWKIITYINLRDAEENFRVLKDYAKTSINFCKKFIKAFWVNCTDCHFNLSTNECTYNYTKHFKTLRHVSILSDHHQGALFLAKVIFTIQFVFANEVLWQHIMLCGNVLWSSG